jgi:UDP-sugar pyrophosphorylase
LKDSYNEVNPYEGYTPFVPAGENVSFNDTEQIHKLESVGAAEIAQTCFVLVAGGLGERLGYEGIKVGIPIELVTKTTFLEYYISFILAYEKRYSKINNFNIIGPDKPLPFAIMTSDDTHTLTLKLL